MSIEDELAKYEPLEDLLDLDAILAALDELDANFTDLDTRNRILRIRTILTFDLGELIERMEQLRNAPVDPPAPPIE